MRDDFAVFILTHGRVDKQDTLKYLQTHNYSGKWFLILDDGDSQLQQYKDKYGEEHCVVFNKQEIAKTFDLADNFDNDKVIVYARNYCYVLAKQLGLTYFMEFDDDYNEFKLRYETPQKTLSAYIINDLEFVFNKMIEWLETNPNIYTVAMYQNGDCIGGINGGPWNEVVKRKAMNTFMCKTDRVIQFRGRFNEDVNAYVCDGAIGKIYLSFRDVVMHQSNTQQSGGGMTDAYQKMGTYVKSFYSVMMAPSCVKIAAMIDRDRKNGNRRIHHSIAWNNAVPKIISDRFKK